MKNNLKWLSQTFKFYMRVDNFLFDTVHTLMQGGVYTTPSLGQGGAYQIHFWMGKEN
jgi:hypothetical protein